MSSLECATFQKLYPVPSVILRPYQQEALTVSKMRFESGITRQLIALPTGTGKTVIFAHLPVHHRIHDRILVVVHRQELVWQARIAFRKWFPGVRIGIEMGSESSCSLDRVVIGSVQSLGRNESSRISRLRPDEFGAVICDEAHHSIASTYQNIFDHFGLLRPTNRKLLLGVTATPVRGDKVALSGVYDQIVYRMSIEDAVQEGWLADIKGLRVSSSTNLDPVRTDSFGDFNKSELSVAVNNDVRNELILKSWQAKAAGRQTIVFCVDIQHAKNMAATFQRAGVQADAIWGSDPDRAVKLDRHKRAELKVLANCEVLTEGYDDWQVSCVVLARPTKSELLFTQMVGRGTRIQPSLGNMVEARIQGKQIDKEDCLVIDVVDNTTRHSLMTLPTLFGLPANSNLNGGSVLRRSATDHNLLQGRTMSDSVAGRVRPQMREIQLLSTHSEMDLLAGSVLTWFEAGAGKYVLPLPDWQEFVIKTTGAGFVVQAQTRSGNYVSDPFNSMKAALVDVGHSIRHLCPELVRKIKDEVNWPVSRATPVQVGLIKNIAPQYPFSQLTRRSAADLILRLYAGQIRPCVEVSEAPQADLHPKGSAEWWVGVLEFWSVISINGRSRFSRNGHARKISVSPKGKKRWIVTGSDRVLPGVKFNSPLAAILALEPSQPFPTPTASVSHASRQLAVEILRASNCTSALDSDVIRKLADESKRIVLQKTIRG